MRNTLQRPAMAMLELIFALVIIGITLMSAPLIVSQSIQGGNVALQQEGIAATAAQISLIQTYYWDENGKDALIGRPEANTPFDTIGFQRVLASDLNKSRRLGIDLPDDSHDLPATATSPARNNVIIPDDIDDFDGNISRIKLYVGGEKTDITQNEGEYLDTAVVLSSTINYSQTENPFTLIAAPSDIKHIQVSLTNDDTSQTAELNKTIILRAFSCNIGKYEPTITTF